jgi:hypothetical protein
MEACMHFFLVEDVVIAVCFHFIQVASGGNTRFGYPESDNDDIADVCLTSCGNSFGEQLPGYAELYLEDGPVVDWR